MKYLLSSLLKLALLNMKKAFRLWVLRCDFAVAVVGQPHPESPQFHCSSDLSPDANYIHLFVLPRGPRCKTMDSNFTSILIIGCRSYSRCCINNPTTLSLIQNGALSPISHVSTNILLTLHHSTDLTYRAISISPSYATFLQWKLPMGIAWVLQRLRPTHRNSRFGQDWVLYHTSYHRPPSIASVVLPRWLQSSLGTGERRTLHLRWN